jgi:hypothetical protein
VTDVVLCMTRRASASKPRSPTGSHPCSARTPGCRRQAATSALRFLRVDSLKQQSIHGEDRGAGAAPSRPAVTPAGTSWRHSLRRAQSR